MIDSIVKFVTGIVKLRGGSDATVIGNTGDRLKVALVPGTQTFDNKDYLNVIATNQVINSPLNSSTANLAAGASFTGTGEEILFTASAQFSLKSDQPCLLQFQQSPDGTNWDISDNYLIPANVGDSRTMQITHLYVRARVTNLGSSTTTYLRLSTIYTAQMEALPRALSSEGRLKVEVKNAEESTSPLGRLRTAEHHTFFEFSHRRGLAGSNLVFDENVSSGGNTTELINKASVQMNTTSTVGSKVIRQTFRYFPYFPGRGTSVLLSGNFNGATTGVRKRLGYFDERDGLFFQLSSSTPSIVRRSYVTGSAVDEVINQTEWNVDALNGSGPSGEVFNVSNQTLFFIEFLWLGSGGARLGCYVGLKKIICHQFSSSNQTANPWSSSASLPIRFEIENLSGSSGSSLIPTCMSILYEGKLEPESGLDHFHVSSGTNELTIGTNTPVGSVRLNPNTNRACIVQINMDLIMTSGTKVIYWRLIKNGSLTNANWGSAGTWSQFDGAATSISGGLEVATGYINISGSTTISPEVFLADADLFLGRKIDGTSEILTLVASTSGGTAKLVYSSKIREYLL